MTLNKALWLIFSQFLGTIYTLSLGWPWFLMHCLVMMYAIWQGYKYKLCHRQYRQLSNGASLTLVMVSVIINTLGSSQPAQALMFDGVETFMVGAFPQTSTLVTFIFNSLRLLFLVYFGISVVNVVRAITSGQETINAIQTPAIITMVIVVADIVSSIFLGGGVSVDVNVE